MSCLCLKAGMNNCTENVQKGVCEKFHLERGNFKKGVGSLEREGLTNNDCNQVHFKAFTMTNFQNFSKIWRILKKSNHKWVSQLANITIYKVIASACLVKYV